MEEFVVSIYFTFFVLFCRVHSTEVPPTLSIGLFRDVHENDGEVRVAGAQIFSAMMLAVNEINDHNDGIQDTLLPKTKIQIAVRSTMNGDYLTAAKDSQDFTHDVFNGTGVAGTIGTGFFDSTKAMALTFSYTHTPNVDFGANSSEFSHGSTYPYFNRVIASDAYDGILLARLIRKHYGFTTVNVIFTNNVYGTDTSGEFFYESEKLGIYVENTYSFWAGTTNFEEMFRNIRVRGILKIFVLIMKSEDAGHIMEAGYNEGLFKENTQILGTQYVMMPATWKAMSHNAPVEKIMKGVIGVRNVLDRNNTNFRSFVDRYRSQQPTKIIHEDGYISCSLAKDDDGHEYLYVKSPDDPPSLCAGIHFPSLAFDGSDLYDETAYAYDAVYTMALAIHKVLYIDKNYNYTGEHINYALEHDVEFYGATGHIKLSLGIGGSQGYGLGDREVGLVYRIVNFNPMFYHKNSKFPEFTLRTLGTWDLDSDAYTPCDKHNDDYCTDPVYNTRFNTVIDDRPSIINVEIEPSVRMFFIAGTCVCLIVIAWYLFILLLFLDTRLMKTSQPSVQMLVLLGATLASLHIALKAVDVSDSTCIASMWLGHGAFASVFVALLFKTWRVGRVVNSGFSKVKITVKDMHRLVYGALGMFAILLAIDTVVGNPHVSSEESFDGHEITRLMKCKNTHPEVTYVIFLIEAFVLFYAAKMCWDAKDAPNAVNDSTKISASIYLILLVCAVTFPIVFLSIEPTPQNLTIVMVSGFIISIIGVVNFLFGGRTYLALIGADVDANFRIVHASGDPNHPFESSLSSGDTWKSAVKTLNKKLKSRLSSQSESNMRTSSHHNLSSPLDRSMTGRRYVHPSDGTHTSRVNHSPPANSDVCHSVRCTGTLNKTQINNLAVQSLSTKKGSLRTLAEASENMKSDYEVKSAFTSPKMYPKSYSVSALSDNDVKDFSVQDNSDPSLKGKNSLCV